MPPPQATFRWLDGNAGAVPGYEFEGRRAPPGHGPPTRTDQPGRAPQAYEGPVWPDPPGEFGGPAQRFRYTPTVSQPPPVPPQAWGPTDLVMPGFEFDARASVVGPVRDDPFPSGPGQVYRRQPDPWAGDAGFPPAGTVPTLLRPTPPASFMPAPPGAPPSGWAQPGRARLVQARLARTAAALGPELRSARDEWVRLLRSFRPQPVKRSWFSRFTEALEFRGTVLRVVLPVLAMIIIGVVVVVLAGANSGRSTSTPAPSSLGFPPATPAGADFTAAGTGRGIDQALGRVASDGDEIVAVGSQAGARIARAQFFISPNDGRSWAMGTIRTPGGGTPPPGYAPRLVAGSHGAWVALGPGSIWTSADGRTWTLASTAGLPARPGDQISVLKRTAAGFIAAGSNAPDADPAKASPVIFLSADGINWQRLDAGELGLAAGAGRVLGIRYAAAYQDQILIAGDVAVPVTGRSGRTAIVRTSAAWLSRNGGTTWMLVVRPGTVPPGHGARAQIVGAAAAADGFILLRPAIAGGQPAVDVYLSPNGSAWTFRATLTTPAGFAAQVVNGGPDGAVVSGRAGRILTAFASANGASWYQSGAFAGAASEVVSGVTLAAGGTVVVAGTAAPSPDSRQPLITLLGPRGGPVRVDVAAIPGAADPELAVNAIAAGASTLVAVGSANGYPAAWTSANGGSSWARATGQTPATLGRPGDQQLTGVTYGPAGWLAVGGVVRGAAAHPVVVTSADGRTWLAADGERAFRGPGLFAEQAAAAPGGYVIVGYQVISGRTSAAAWWSAGLTGWHRAGVAAANDQMLAVTATPRGLVAVGWHGDRPSAWTSPGGQAWARADLPLPVGTTRAVLEHVASNGRAVVAVGTVLTTSGEELPFAASSSDGGASWAEAALPVPSGRAFVTALAASGRGFTATGTFGRTQGHQDVVVWTSATGLSWQAVTPAGLGLTGPGIQAITGLTAVDSTLTGVGFTASPAGEEPTFWQSPIR